mmetsp:Transcript_22988/g.32045  ORF Transcript_22988/g.32045 Transcript_22988/m.32045 type:complete len:89 (+) Transcript_22988:792-1058(+)
MIFPEWFARRTFIAWDDILFARIIDQQLRYGTSQFIKIVSRTKKDYVGDVPSDTRAWSAVVAEMKSRNIPILGEADQFQPNTNIILVP